MGSVSFLVVTYFWVGLPLELGEAQLWQQMRLLELNLLPFTHWTKTGQKSNRSSQAVPNTGVTAAAEARR